MNKASIHKLLLGGGPESEVAVVQLAADITAFVSAESAKRNFDNKQDVFLGTLLVSFGAQLMHTGIFNSMCNIAQRVERMDKMLRDLGEKHNQLVGVVDKTSDRNRKSFDELRDFLLAKLDKIFARTDEQSN